MTTKLHPSHTSLRPHTTRSSSTAHQRFATILLAPAAMLLCILVLLPCVFLIIAAFTNFNAQSLFTGNFDLVGVQQFTRALSSPELYHSLIITAIFTLALVASSILIGMWIANIMTHTSAPVRLLVLLTLIIAWGIPNVASALVWNWMFQPGFGIVNTLLTKLHIFGDIQALSWTSYTPLAFLMIATLIIWQAVPYIAITLYGAQMQISQSLLEAASLDGAHHRTVYWHIIVPIIRPHLVTLTLLSCIWDFNAFNQIWLLTQGGPSAGTSVISVFTYQKAFISYDIGQGAAISVITMVILMAITAVQLKRLIQEGSQL